MRHLEGRIEKNKNVFYFFGLFIFYLFNFFFLLENIFNLIIRILFQRTHTFQLAPRIYIHSERKRKTCGKRIL